MSSHQINGISKQDKNNHQNPNEKSSVIVNNDDKVVKSTCMSDNVDVVNTTFDKNKGNSLCIDINAPSSSAKDPATKNISKDSDKKGDSIAEKLMDSDYWNNNDSTFFDTSLQSTTQTSFQHQYSCPNQQDILKNSQGDLLFEDNKDTGLENMTLKLKSFFNSNKNLNMKSDKVPNKSDWWERIRTKAKTCLRMTHDKKELGIRWKSKRAESSSSDTVVCIGNESSNLDHFDLSRFQTHHLTDPNLLKHTEQTKIESIFSCSLQNSKNEGVNEKIKFTCEESVPDHKTSSSRENSNKRPLHPNDISDLTNSTFSSLKQATNNTNEIQYLSFNEEKKPKSKNDLISNFREKSSKQKTMKPQDENSLLISCEVFDSLKPSSNGHSFKTVTINKHQLDFTNKSSDHKLFPTSFQVLVELFSLSFAF